MSVARFVLAARAVAASMAVLLPVHAETVGKAVLVRTTVVGANGNIAPRDPVSRDERIRTNATGLGQFQFDDGSKLALGPNASIVIDEYVLGDGNRLRAMALNTVKGAFRWISGKSPSSAYRIETPFGTLGVRGTAVDGYIGNGVVMFVLLKGGVTFCQVAPLSRETFTSPSSLPAQKRPGVWSDSSNARMLEFTSTPVFS